MARFRFGPPAPRFLDSAENWYWGAQFSVGSGPRRLVLVRGVNLDLAAGLWISQLNFGIRSWAPELELAHILGLTWDLALGLQLGSPLPSRYHKCVVSKLDRFSRSTDDLFSQVWLRFARSHGFVLGLMVPC